MRMNKYLSETVVSGSTASISVNMVAERTGLFCPLDLPVDLPLDFPLDIPVDFPLDIPVNLSLDLPMDLPLDFHLDIPMDFPLDIPMDLPLDLPVDLPLDFPLDIPMNFPLNIPVDLPLDLPMDLPLDFPLDIPVDFLLDIPMSEILQKKKANQGTAYANQVLSNLLINVSFVGIPVQQSRGTDISVSQGSERPVMKRILALTNVGQRPNMICWCWIAA